MDVSLFDYELPADRIAQAPVRPRERAKMLYYDRGLGIYRDHRVADLPSLLLPGDLLVFNVSKVRHARLHGSRDARRLTPEVEILVLKPLTEDGRFECLIRGKSIQIGETMSLPEGCIVTVIDRIQDPVMGRFV